MSSSSSSSSSSRSTGPSAPSIASSFVLAPTPPPTTADPDDDGDDDDAAPPPSPSPTGSTGSSRAAAAARAARAARTIFVEDEDEEDDDDEEDEDEDEDEAQREWRESLQQLELLLTMVVVPYVGKYFGRKAAYWGACPLPPPHFLSFGLRIPLRLSDVLLVDWFARINGWLWLIAVGRVCVGWAKYMTWKHPVEIVVADPSAFKAAGVVGTAAAL